VNLGERLVTALVEFGKLGQRREKQRWQNGQALVDCWDFLGKVLVQAKHACRQSWSPTTTTGTPTTSSET